MNVSRPSDAIAPSLDGPVLVALSKLETPVTGRHLHSLAGAGSEAGVRNVLNRLVGQGLVRASPAGNAVLYSLNRDHIAWPVVQGLAGLRGELLARLRGAFDEWSPQVRCAALFGSAARGDGDTESDIDLLLVRPNRTDADDVAWLAQVALLRDHVTTWTGNTCQVLDLGSQDLERLVTLRDPIVTSWRSDAITLAGAEVRALLREVGHRVEA